MESIKNAILKIVVTVLSTAMLGYQLLKDWKASWRSPNISERDTARFSAGCVLGALVVGFLIGLGVG